MNKDNQTHIWRMNRYIELTVLIVLTGLMFFLGIYNSYIAIEVLTKGEYFTVNINGSYLVYSLVCHSMATILFVITNAYFQTMKLYDLFSG